MPATAGCQKIHRDKQIRRPRESGDRALASAFCQGGASPPQVCLLRPVAERNCVAARRGGEQQEAKEPSVG